MDEGFSIAFAEERELPGRQPIKLRI